ncbi:signal recognition particle 54 kDa protein [Histomonas meleagridis]|nr:signal recognition particle 54 kDa protein [Histomonas meleagridis]
MSDNVKRMLYVMDSMTDEKWRTRFSFEKRTEERIARGCGMPLVFVQCSQSRAKAYCKDVLKDEQANARAADTNGPKPQLAKRDQSNKLGSMSRAMDPKMLQQLSGVTGLSNLMKKSMAASKMNTGK